jgi:alginate O-acetyltransferase complex protein AlgI
MVLSCGLDIFLSRRFESEHRKTAFWTGIISNVLILWYFKYSNFFIDQFNVLSSSLGLGAIGWAKVALPAGVSFYTFEKISYLVDVYRGHVPPAKDFKSYLLFVSFFPHLIAGPILRYADISKQIASRSHNWSLFFDGVCRLSVGLARKVLIADEMGQVADNILQLPDAQTSFGLAWLGMICYSFQIYFDFSAYSDMAIGLARMFGFTFQENFNHPYISRSISDFWQRWHISFSKWMRDYLYIPMGGNRSGPIRTYFNLVTCFLLSGFWHGASWNFVLWGAFHGVFLLMDRVFLLKLTEKLPLWLMISFTFLLVTISRVMFRLEHFDESLSMYSIMFGFSPAPSWLPPLESVINTRAWIVFILACLLSFVTPFLFNYEKAPAWVKGIAAIVLFVFSIITLTSVEFSPFLYYQF